MTSCFTFVWRIENFSYYWKKLDRVEIMSPEFEVNYITGWTKVRFLFSDRDFSNDRLHSINDKDIRLFFQETDGNVWHSKDVRFSVSLVRNDKSVFTYGNARGVQDIINFSEIMSLNGRKVLLSMRDELLPKDVLTVLCRIWNSNLVEGQCFARTLLAVERMHFEAVMEEVSDLIPGLKRAVEIKSKSVVQPVFHLCVCLSENGKLVIKIAVEADNVHLYFCEMFILLCSGNWTKCGQDSEWRKIGEVCEFPLTLDFKTLTEKQKYLRNDMATFKCEVTYTTEAEPQKTETIKYGLDYFKILQPKSPFVKNTPAPEAKKEILQSASTLAEDLVSLYKERTLCDTTLRTETEAFSSHKTILSARSPVFKKMFTTDMREKTVDFVEIQDLNADTVRKLLVYAYTDTVDLMDWQSAKELYFAADKYEIVSLKLKCSSFLKVNIRPSNCCDVLLLSDMHQDTDLKQFVQDYIIRRDQDVFGSDEWKNFVANHVQLAADTMCLKYAQN